MASIAIIKEGYKAYTGTMYNFWKWIMIVTNAGRKGFTKVILNMYNGFLFPLKCEMNILYIGKLLWFPLSSSEPWLPKLFLVFKNKTFSVSCAMQFHFSGVDLWKTISFPSCYGWSIPPPSPHTTLWIQWLGWCIVEMNLFFFLITDVATSTDGAQSTVTVDVKTPTPKDGSK